MKKDEDSAVPRLTEEQAAIMMALEELMAEIKEASRDDFLSIFCLKKYDNE